MVRASPAPPGGPAARLQPSPRRAMSRSRRFRAASTVGASIAVAAVTGTCALAPARAATASARAATAFRHPPRSIAAYAAELADGTTGKQLWGRRQYSPRPIASITKVMTALGGVQARPPGRRIKITPPDPEDAR